MHIIHMYLHTDIYIYIYIYIRMRTPHQDIPSFVFHWLFHCKVNHLLSAICQKNTNTNIKTKNTKTKCIGEPSPLPPSQSRSPKTLFFIVFVLVLLVFFKDLIPRIYPDYIIQINPSQIWFIWPLRHHVSIKCILHNHNQKSIVCFKHAQVFLGDVQFSFQVWGLWECTILLAVSGAFLSNKWSCCLNRGQLGFFERSVAYVQTN